MLKIYGYLEKNEIVKYNQLISDYKIFVN